MPTTLTDLTVLDIRFPTSRQLDGSDAMNPDPDYSATYVILKTDRGDGLEGHGLTFTIGRGNEICVKAVEALKPFVVGLTMESIRADMAGFWHRLAGDSQLRWLGPEKGVIHLALAAVINAVWDLWAKEEGKPLWQLLADLSPEDLVACLDFTHVTDALTQEEALAILKEKRSTRDERETFLKKEGFPAYTTAVGWLGYSDEKVERLCRESLAEGWTHFKLKVGADEEEDCRRAGMIRKIIGPECKLMVDANQYWGVEEAIRKMKKLAAFDPWWIEEPTHPDDVLGHAAIARAIDPIRVATGEHCQNRILFKQFFQAEALSFCQLDCARLGGVNEVILVLLMAAKYGVPVCPHGGGVGLCEYSLHICVFDYLCVSGSLEDRVLEYVHHLHEHFVDPVRIRRGRYLVPDKPGYSGEIHADSLDEHRFPDGKAWTSSS